MRPSLKSSFSVVIVSYNVREHLRACLASVCAESPSQIIVVDNASSDGSAEMVKRDYPWVKLVANKVNAGYSAAANRGIADCASRYVLLLNCDTVLQPGALRALSDYFDRNLRAAVVGPRVVNPDGSLQASCYPFLTPLNTLLVETSLSKLIRYIPIIKDRHLRTWPHDRARAVPWLLGAALAIRREAFEDIGGFDESFFMYYEEVDLCYRLADAGWQTHFAPVANVVHAGGASSTQLRTQMRIEYFASALKFYSRHYSGIQYAELVLVMKSIILVRWLIGTLRLCLRTDENERARIAADMAAWKQVILGRCSRQGES